MQHESVRIEADALAALDRDAPIGERLEFGAVLMPFVPARIGVIEEVGLRRQEVGVIDR
jgi:hypothetical protein